MTTATNIKHKLDHESAAASRLMHNLAEAIGDDDTLRLDTIEGETDLIELIDQAVQRISEIDGLCTGIKSQQDRLKRRRERLEKQASTLRISIEHAMLESNLQRLEFSASTVCMSANPPKVVITDPNQIPTLYMRHKEPEPDKIALKKALQAGDEITGATLSNGGQSLNIRYA